MANGMNGGFTRDLDTNALLVTGSVAAAGGLTDTELRATPVPVSGTVTATGPLTDTQLRATPVPVSGTVTATGPLTDTQLRAASVPVLSAPQTGAVYSGTSALTPKFAFVNIAASQTNASVVALVASKKIRVLAATFVAGGTATDLTFRTGTSADISCKFANGANGGAALAFNPCGWFETVAGEALTVTTGAGSTTGIQVVYVEV